MKSLRTHLFIFVAAIFFPAAAACAAVTFAVPWVNLVQSAGGSSVAALVGNVTVNESGTGAIRTVMVGDAFLIGEPAHPQRLIRLHVNQQ